MWCYGSSEAAMAGYDQKSEIADDEKHSVLHITLECKWQ